MLIPKFWAEASVSLTRRTTNGRTKSRVIKRWGWSSESEALALDHAWQRLAQAHAAVLAGKEVRSIERRHLYPLEEGEPIREEVLQEVGGTVLTRNTYGAVCLNSPNVLFVDIDHTPVKAQWEMHATIFLVLVGMLNALWTEHALREAPAVLRLVAAMPLAALCWLLVARPALDWLWRKFKPTPFETSLARVKDFAAKNPSWSLRVYETPAGLRVLVQHRTFTPNEPEVDYAFKALGADQRYAGLCRRQQCFRARLTPKPWRMGEWKEDALSRKAWPVKGADLATRQAWVEKYDLARIPYAGCKFLLELGATTPCEEARHVRSVHDELSKANSTLSLA